jgi:hypothetical protein
LLPNLISMTKRYHHLLLLCFAFICTSLRAQPPCGFDVLHNQLLQRNPEYARQVELNEQSIQQFINRHPQLLNRTEATYTIPVVVHVMHTGGAVGTIYNPTDAQITGAINYLNQVFAGTYPGMQAPVEGGGVVDMDVQFGLAQRTPSCGATNGIDRVDASSLPNYVTNGVNAQTSSGCPELTMKNLSRWNTADYYNIWIVNKIDGADGTSGQFIAGFAYFPGSSSSLDGTVMLSTQMVSGAKTLSHEIGHALNLYHTFQGSANTSECPANATCTSDGDRVCDTDPVPNNLNASTGVYSFACRTGAIGCPGTGNYTINTESNFMAYTNCYTLFTNGQKARAQAAMSLASRASLVAPGNLALTPCGTNINFASATSSQTENISGTVSGCRKYTDYTYQMAIGAAPSATATATLTYTGTSVKGLDYDVTTNGNFTTPSDVLTFNSGLTAAQSFTVRVYDDASVETSETIIIDFTVNNGGGNAAKGTTAPTLTVTLNDNDNAPVATSSNIYSLGSTSVLTTARPFDATQQSQRSQYLYYANELTAPGMISGNINSLQLFVNVKASTRAFTNFTIKMGQTTTAPLVDAAVGVSVINGLTTVYTNASLSTAPGWNTFTFSTPFAWNGTSNLVYEICFDNGSVSAGAGADQIALYSDGNASTIGNNFWQNGINCSGSFTSVSYSGFGRKPIIKLGLDVAGISVETASGSTAATHIATGSDDYFYSNNNKLLFRLNGVNASLGCVNAALDAGGTSWVTTASGQRSAKVFGITPTTNVTTTGYTISLYFDNTELGGKVPSSLRIAKTTAATAAGANGSNTVFVTPTVTTLGSGITVFTAPFTGFSRFFLVDAGFVLPVSITAFTATANAQRNTVVRWATSFEQDNKDFTIEISYDGINFVPLTIVSSKGNSSSLQQYEYLHVKPAKGTTWYRLKQTDRNGIFKYSPIAAVQIANDNAKPFLYPVPATDILTVNFGTVVNKPGIEILTADMRVVHRETSAALSVKKDIDVSKLASGIYFVKITGGVSNELLRFVKQ